MCDFYFNLYFYYYNNLEHHLLESCDFFLAVEGASCHSIWNFVCGSFLMWEWIWGFAERICIFICQGPKSIIKMVSLKLFDWNSPELKSIWDWDYGCLILEGVIILFYSVPRSEKISYIHVFFAGWSFILVYLTSRNL